MSSLGIHKALAVLAALAALTGCSANATRVYVKTGPQTNDGRLLYMMVRAAEGKATVSERYQEVADKLFSATPDPAIITSQPLMPNTTVSVTIDESDKDVVLYFFFTNPGTDWRVPLRKPLPAEVYIDLGLHQVERVQVRRR